MQCTVLQAYVTVGVQTLHGEQKMVVIIVYDVCSPRAVCAAHSTLLYIIRMKPATAAMTKPEAM
jgi:hypothetical protein